MNQVVRTLSRQTPAIIAAAGERAQKRFFEFFVATIRNVNTRRAYARAIDDFLTRCHQHGIHELVDTEPIHVGAFIEQLTGSGARPPRN